MFLCIIILLIGRMTCHFQNTCVLQGTSILNLYMICMTVFVKRKFRFSGTDKKNYIHIVMRNLRQMTLRG